MSGAQLITSKCLFYFHFKYGISICNFLAFLRRWPTIFSQKIFIFDNKKFKTAKGVVMFVHVFFVQVTILNIAWRSQRADAPRCAHFSIDICCVIQEGVITVEKCVHIGASAY